MKHIVIIPNPKRDEGLSVTKRLSKMLITLGAVVYVDEKYENDFPSSVQRYGIFPSCADLIIVVGGDGSILDASSVALEYDLPLVGVNLGKVGYLSEIELDELDLLNRLFSGQYTVDEKMLLTVSKVFAGEEKACERLAVNDVIISRDSFLGIADFTLENSVVFSEGFDGFIMSLYDENENDCMRIITEDGYFKALGGANEYVPLLQPESTLGKHWFNIILDFDEQTITYYIDSMWCATLPMLAKSFKYLKVGTLGTHKVGVEMSGPVDLYANFPLHDSFKHYPQGSVPFMWKAEGDVKVNGKDELVLLSENGDACAYKKF
ncbi:MAG: NAD(+)/NADH kinase, partial [Clostridia bacterium]|nr:NAD(+)/NADH kinase [Clostridia bacterium]